MVNSAPKVNLTNKCQVDVKGIIKVHMGISRVILKPEQPFSLMGPHWGWKLVTRVCVTDLSETNFF